MSHAELATIIDDAFEKREGIGPATTGAVVREAVDAALDLLDRGKARVAERAADRQLAGESVAQEGSAALVSACRT